METVLLNKTLAEITRKTPSIHKEVFLVRGVGKRAMEVCLMADANTSAKVSSLLSEYELYWLLVESAKYVQKHFGWKQYIIRLPYLSEMFRHAIVEISNISGRRFSLGDLGTLVDIDHFTNDNYYCPRHFYIPEYESKS